MDSFCFISMEFDGALFSVSPKWYVRSAGYPQKSMQMVTWKKLAPGFCVLTCFDGDALPVTLGIARITEESALLAGCFFNFNWDDQITYSKPRVQHIKHVVSRQGGFATKCIQILDPCWGTSRILIIREHQAINYKISQYVPSVLNDYSIHSNYGNGQSYFDDFTIMQISSCI